jgi:hypothetical protein
MSANNKNTMGLQNAHITLLQQRDKMEAALLTYGTAQEVEAQLAHLQAHAALDALLDAQRAKHYYSVRVIKGNGL